MFALERPQQSSEAETGNSSNKCTPNILPCRIHHDGPIASLDRYWRPISDDNDKNLQTAHFRGRKLRSRRVAIPEGYQGVVAIPTDRTIRPSQDVTTTANEDGTPEDPVKVLEQQSTFDEVMVWGHEIIPAADDPYVKGVEEWVKFAETIHTQPCAEKQSST